MAEQGPSAEGGRDAEQQYLANIEAALAEVRRMRAEEMPDDALVDPKVWNRYLGHLGTIAVQAMELQAMLQLAMYALAHEKGVVEPQPGEQN